MWRARCCRRCTGPARASRPQCAASARAAPELGTSRVDRAVFEESVAGIVARALRASSRIGAAMRIHSWSIRCPASAVPHVASVAGRRRRARRTPVPATMSPGTPGSHSRFTSTDVAPTRSRRGRDDSGGRIGERDEHAAAGTDARVRARSAAQTPRALRQVPIRQPDRGRCECQRSGDRSAWWKSPVVTETADMPGTGSPAEPPPARAASHR